MTEKIYNPEDKDGEGFVEEVEEKDAPDLRPYKTKTDKEIKELAMSFYKGEIFIDRQVPEGEINLLGSIFMPLFFAGESLIKWIEDNEIDMLYANLSDAMPRCINGYPMFSSINMLDKNDTVRFMEKYNQIVDAMENV